MAAADGDAAGAPDDVFEDMRRGRRHRSMDVPRAHVTAIWGRAHRARLVRGTAYSVFDGTRRYAMMLSDAGRPFLVFRHLDDATTRVCAVTRAQGRFRSLANQARIFARSENNAGRHPWIVADFRDLPQLGGVAEAGVDVGHLLEQTGPHPGWHPHLEHELASVEPLGDRRLLAKELDDDLGGGFEVGVPWFDA